MRVGDLRGELNLVFAEPGARQRVFKSQPALRAGRKLWRYFLLYLFNFLIGESVLVTIL